MHVARRAKVESVSGEREGALTIANKEGGGPTESNSGAAAFTFFFPRTPKPSEIKKKKLFKKM